MTDSFAEMIHAYNIMHHATIGFSPFVLMFGCEDKLPIDLSLDMFGIETDNNLL